MKRRLIGWLVGCLWTLAAIAPHAGACTAFVLRHPDRILMGEGFDWHTGAGIITITPQGLIQESIEARLQNRTPWTWTVRYGSVTFSWTGISLPTCGMNTAGLAVTGLLFSQSRLPEIGEAPVIGISQWKQYVLDTCATVPEAVATLDRMRLATLSPYGVHYLLADRSGNAAVVQFVDGHGRVYQGSSLSVPVLTNDIRMDTVRTQVAIGDGRQTGLAVTAPDRFQRASKLVGEASADAVERLDHWADRIFDSVRIDGLTRWNIAFDLTGLRIWVRTDTVPQRRTIDLKAIDFSCRLGLRAAPIHSGAPTGPIAFSQDLADSGYQDRLAHLNRIIRLSPESLDVLSAYPRNRSCSAGETAAVSPK